MPTITGTRRPSKAKGDTSLFILFKVGSPCCFYILMYLLKHVFVGCILYDVCTINLLILI